MKYTWKEFSMPLKAKISKKDIRLILRLQREQEKAMKRAFEEVLFRED